jgi:hypothetical protein
MKRKKKEILGRIEEMDDKAEAHGLCEEDCKWRYKLEGDLEEVLEYEEQIWQAVGIEGELKFKIFP